jgi:hypothetical protein
MPSMETQNATTIAVRPSKNVFFRALRIIEKMMTKKAPRHNRTTGSEMSVI